jgi:hypothetical protein
MAVKLATARPERNCPSPLVTGDTSGSARCYTIAPARARIHRGPVSIRSPERRRALRLTGTLLLLSCGGGMKHLQTAGDSEGEYPVVESWPVLPEGYVLGEVTGVAVDSKDRVFIFHRADKQWGNDALITRPTVLVLDGDTGRMVATWGENLFKVPHGLSIDEDDNVWLTDVKLQRVFKFSPDGQLLLQLGEGE